MPSSARHASHPERSRAALAGPCATLALTVASRGSMKQRAIVAAPAFVLHRFALVLALTLLAPLALAACQPAPASAPRAAPPAGAPPTAGAPAQSGAVPSQPAAPAAASVPTP